MPFADRAELLLALRSVDAVVGFRERTPEVLLDRIRPDVHVKSDQYREDELPERTSCSRTAAESRSRRTRPERARPIRSRASSMRIAVTANGPGEVAGWVRPLLRALYRRRPDLEALVFLVPDDYATGFEAKIVRDSFPQARVFDSEELL